MMHSNRFVGQTNGHALDAPSSSASGTMTLASGGSGTLVYTTTGAVYGAALSVTTVSGWSPAFTTSPPGQTEARGHFLLRVPSAAPSAGLDILNVGLGGTGSCIVTVQPTGALTLWDGSAGTTLTAAGSLPAAGSLIRVAWAVKLTASGSGSTVKACVYSGDTATVLGTSVTRTITTAANATIGDINHVPGGVSGYTLTLPAIRAEWGPGCIDTHLLPETAYTPSTTPVIGRVAALTAGSVTTAAALTNLTDNSTSTAVTATTLRAALTPAALTGGGLRITLTGLTGTAGATLTASLVDTTLGQTVSTATAAVPASAADTTLTWPATDLAWLTAAQLESLEILIGVA